MLELRLCGSESGNIYIRLCTPRVLLNQLQCENFRLQYLDMPSPDIYVPPPPQCRLLRLHNKSINQEISFSQYSESLNFAYKLTLQKGENTVLNELDFADGFLTTDQWLLSCEVF